MIVALNIRNAVYNQYKKIQKQLISQALLHKIFLVIVLTLHRLSEQFPSDEHPPDFAGAGADFVKFGIAQ